MGWLGRAGLDLGHVGPVRSFVPWLSVMWVTNKLSNVANMISKLVIKYLIYIVTDISFSKLDILFT